VTRDSLLSLPQAIMPIPGIHVVCGDLNKEAAESTAKELTDVYGSGIGVAGTGISACGPAIGLGVDVTNRASVRQMLLQTVLAYGGVDNVVVTAGVFMAPDKDGHVTDAQWKTTFDVNVTGSYLVADEARALWAR
jgi:NAD(P)-dependent dehydrogenase (short-subunit alcohol dehydrogenase family)